LEAASKDKEHYKSAGVETSMNLAGYANNVQKDRDNKSACI